MITTSGAPVIAQAARMMCSSCSRRIAETLLDRPHLPGRQNPDKRAVLSQPLRFFALVLQQLKQLLERIRVKNRLPLVVTALHGNRQAWPAQPPLQVATRNLDQCRIFAQPPGDLAVHREAATVDFSVSHWRHRRKACTTRE